MSDIFGPLRKVTVSYWIWDENPDCMWVEEDFPDAGEIGGPRPKEEVEEYIEFLRRWYEVTDLGEIAK